MFVIVDLQKMRDTKHVDTFMVWICTKFHTPSSDDLGVIAIKLMAKENVHSTAMFCEKVTWIKIE
jgi:hypothetical protein